MRPSRGSAKSGDWPCQHDLYAPVCGEIFGVSGRIEKPALAVREEISDLSGGRSHDGETEGHEFEDLQGREVEIIEVRVGCDRYVCAPEPLGNLGVRNLSRHVNAIRQTALGHAADAH